MAGKRMLWQLFLPFFVVIVVSLIIIIWHSSDSLYHFYQEQTAIDLKARAYLISRQIITLIESDRVSDINQVCKELGHKSSTRITVMLPDGTVVGDSENNPDRMEGHASRPEMSDALKGNIGQSTRYSSTLHKDLMYIAIPIIMDDSVAVVVRTSLPVSLMGDAMSDLTFRIISGGVIVAVLAALISLVLSRKISRPLEEMKEGARRFARGEFGYKLPAPETGEVSELAEAMNLMAEQLDDRIHTIIMQRNEQEAMLASMTEGILAVDTDERLLNINQAAAKLFSINPAAVKGRSILEAVRNTDLHRLVTKTFQAHDTVEGEIILNGDTRKYLQAHGTILHDGNGRKIGALIVLNDMTRLRLLENVRRDFVANVSHELKTPITSIKGFIETLQDGAINDAEETARFLEIISRQADRLNAIIEDILNLSRIEQNADAGEILFEIGSVSDLINSAINTCEIKASEKSISIEHSCMEEIKMEMNVLLLEQALINLLDNAIKYSDAGKQIQVICSASNGIVEISVHDEGCGISDDHFPRLFERFYRVDRARSRKLGGTGLGLAIVKHIVLAHGGRIDVQSKIGKGSTFTILLPRDRNKALMSS